MKHNIREFFGPTKQEIQADAPDESRHKGGKRKNTKDWCKGKKGRHHQPVIEIPTNAIFAKLGRSCGWVTHDYVFGEEGARYRCDHAEVCSVCGKILRHAPFMWGNDGKYSISVTECPGYTPEPSTLWNTAKARTPPQVRAFCRLLSGFRLGLLEPIDRRAYVVQERVRVVLVIDDQIEQRPAGVVVLDRQGDERTIVCVLLDVQVHLGGQVGDAAPVVRDEDSHADTFDAAPFLARVFGAGLT